MHVSPRMAVFTVAGTLAYLGLAAVGEGGLAPFLSHSPLVTLAIVTLGHRLIKRIQIRAAASLTRAR